MSNWDLAAGGNLIWFIIFSYSSFISLKFSVLLSCFYLVVSLILFSDFCLMLDSSMLGIKLLI